jgi:Fe2+ transport system protein FeoA
MSAGEVANVAEILGRPEQVHRLQELGLRRGVLIEMVQPGSPCIIRFGGQKLCFRGDELMSVLVRVGAAA